MDSVDGGCRRRQKVVLVVQVVVKKIPRWLFYDLPGGRLRLGFLVLLDNLVVGQLYAGGTLQELLHAVTGIVGGALRGEYYVQVLDVVVDGEGLGRTGTLAVDADLERAEAVQLHALGILQLVTHGLYLLFISFPSCF